MSALWGAHHEAPLGWRTGLDPGLAGLGDNHPQTGPNRPFALAQDRDHTAHTGETQRIANPHHDRPANCDTASRTNPERSRTLALLQLSLIRNSAADGRRAIAC